MRKGITLTIASAFTTTLGILCTYALSGCVSVEPHDVKPPIEVPDSFSARGAEPLADRWWLSLNDPNLAALIEQAMADNFSIRSAWDRLTQAEQTAVKAGTGLLPSATYGGRARRTRQDVDSRTDYTSNYSVSAAASYELDLWGKIRSSRQAALLDAHAARDDVDTAAITLSAAIAQTWYQLAEAREQQVVIQQQIEVNRKVLEVVTLQFSKSQVGAADVFRQEQLLESTRGGLIQAQERTVLLEHQLSILLGKSPGSWRPETPRLIAPGRLVTIDIPSVVLQRRPDIRSRYTQVQAADMRTASAIADQYPVISLTAGVETSAQKTHDLFDDWLANLAANAAGPLFDAGYRKAEVLRTQAVLSQKINDYSQSLLVALREVEDAIQQEKHQHQTVRNLQKQLELARQVYDRTRQNYLKGQLDYLRVLESLVSQQSLERSELTARRVLMERRIELCRSIAGGWPIARPEQAVLTQP
ncbi:MAG TPA: efflux transporter outer membrane subunit [Anaerohalosphaeraceae bacterium]|nr:efflux transporter outer membrane subunit [Anaerohalosphaeraceae bacterium]